MRLLVIEDDKTLATQLGKTLSDAGHVVQCANDGSAGLKLAKAQPYDALIVDRMLPKMDGLDVIASLRSSGSRVPILILSALGEVDDRVKGLRSGGDDYLVKPFSYDELMARLDIMVRRSQQQTAPETQLKVGDLVVD
ncbi:MAG: response regulator transcription factor, partial [Alphaproteobacteria bacterium]|nr:response regulator transcription factor [Alphaproteobacteria bacterium]